MLKFIISTASLFATAQAAMGTGGITVYQWPDDTTVTPPVTAYSVALEVTDPINSGHASLINNRIEVAVTASTTITYVGLWPGATVSDTTATPTSHTEQATGGPITKVTCAAGATNCLLPLYQNGNVLNPVRSGVYRAVAVNGNDLTYGSAIFTNNVAVTINPYFYQWGSYGSMKQVQDGVNSQVNIIERGTSIQVSWDNYNAVEGDVIEFRNTITAVYDCPVDYYILTAADVVLKRGTISLATAQVPAKAGKTYKNNVRFALPTSGTISFLKSTYATLAASGTAAGNYGVNLAGCKDQVDIAVAANKWALARVVKIAETDTIAAEGQTGGNAILKVGQTGTAAASTAQLLQAGSSLSITYNLVVAPTSGAYAGLFPLLTAYPLSHTVGGTNGPKSIVNLPLGAAGPGLVYLNIPLTATAGNYVVMLLNSNDDSFTPLADSTYPAAAANFDDSGVAGIGVTVAHNTDITIVAAPTGQPSDKPSGQPSGQPSGVPTSPTGQPTGIPTSSPSFVEEPWGEYLWTEKRHRKAGMCENQCSGHGTCEVNGNCKCFKGLDGEAEWTGPDCSLRTCPFDFAWIALPINSNNVHPWAECSNKGTCDRSSGECQCFTGYEGAACQRTICPDNCNDQGTCWPEKHLASKAGRVYAVPWDAMKHVGCLCDAGYRGPACDQQECPSGADPLSGYGNEAGRDCSGRGICDYSSGICACFTGFFGTRCQHQTTVM